MGNMAFEEKKDYKFEPLINKDQLIPKRNVSKTCNKVRMEIQNSLKGINSFYQKHLIILIYLMAQIQILILITDQLQRKLYMLTQI